jgi:hypothetical protein
MTAGASATSEPWWVGDCGARSAMAVVLGVERGRGGEAVGGQTSCRSWREEEEFEEFEEG